MIISKATDVYLDDFKILLEKAKLNIENLSSKDVPSGELFEGYLLDILKQLSESSIFEGTFEITSKNAFPDIISKIEKNNWLGIEVKTSQKDWKCFGNSIFENTRIKEVDNIFIFFLRVNPKINCRWDYYANCIETINITHSPRYLINMNMVLEKKENVFSLFGLSYDSFRNLPTQDRMNLVIKLKKKELGPDVALWWLPDDKTNEGDDSKLVIRLFNEIPVALRNTIKAKAVIFFPELFLEKSPKKYLNVSKWLAAEFGVVSHSLRDIFSAGGKFKVFLDGQEFILPRIFSLLDIQRNDIKDLFNILDTDELLAHWPKSHKQEDLLLRWIDLVISYATKSNQINKPFLVKWLRRLYLI